MAEPDNLLIAEFNARRTEESFAALVRMHVDLVFATALRQVGDRAIAEEVTQTVFIELAQNAGKLGRHPTIAGWLHRTTLNKARGRLRSELRRQHREQVAVHLELAKAEGESVWAALVPLLDEALLELRERDRLAVIMHFMEGQTFREVGSTLGVGEDAARKRVHGCLDQLAVFFRRRGFVAPAFATGASLFALSTHAAPAGLAASATTAGLAAAKAAGTSALTLYALMASTKLKIAAGLVLLAGVGTTLVLEHQKQTSLRADNAGLQQRVEALDQENQRLIAQATQPKTQNLDAGKVGSKPKRLSLAEIPAAIQAALKKPFSQHADAFKEIVAAVSPADFAQVVAMLERFPNFEAKTTLRSLFLARWAEADAPAAMAAATATANRTDQHEAALAVARVWASSDLDAALAWAGKLPPNQSRNEALQAIIVSAAETNPSRAADLAFKLPGRWQAFAVEKVAAQWVQMDPDATLAWLKTLPAGNAQSRALDAVSEKLAQANPEAAAVLASSLPAGIGARFLSEIASSWAERDLAGSIAWAEQLTEKNRKLAFQSISQQWAQVDPKAAAEYMQKAQPDSLYTVGLDWGKNDPQAAMNWVKQLTDGKSRDAMYRAILSGWSASSPSDAAAFVANLPAGPLQMTTAEAVASNWAENDPGAAAAWASSFPEGDERGLAFQNVVLHWGRSDPNGVAEWLKTLPQGDSRDTAIVTFANNCLKDYAPSTALEWAQTITGDGVRNNITRKLSAEWLTADPAAAQTWIANSALPEKTKTDLLRR